MSKVLVWCVAVTLAVAAGPTSALPGTFAIDQIFSNADGSIQFVVIIDHGANDCDAGENLWAGQPLRSVGAGGPLTFTFSANLPTCHTSGRRMLIATQGFAALGLVTPDYVIPNDFIQRPSGRLVFADISSVVYTALPDDGVTAIDGNGVPIPNVATNLAGASASVLAGATSSPVNVVEYYNAVLDHYFITWVAAEQANLDAGKTPTKWNRTGYSFNTHTQPQAGASAVCRYYIPPGLGDSHFFGRGTVECNATGQKNPTFVLEDPAFMHMFLPIAGTCPAGTNSIYRVFSNRADANHRYMTDKTVRDSMVAKGWIAEGDGPDLVVMCGP